MKKTAARLLFLLALVPGFAFGQSAILNTKHNLSATGPGSIKSAPTGSGGTTEICVFCHTAHGASLTALTEAGKLVPLWNRLQPGATYTLYQSDYLTSLNYPGTPTGTPTSPSQPTTRSKLCLSCHDGTIALGSVYNLPGSGGYSDPPGAGIPMIGATAEGKMPSTAAGYLDTNLTDDHPVGFMYKPGSAAGQDPELLVRAWPWPDSVSNCLKPCIQLDPNTSTGTVECQTCHDPHNNQYTKFLRTQISDGTLTTYLCTYCHVKTNYAVSAHASATTASYTPAGGTATTVSQYACRSCHKPHSSGGTPYILRGAEENTCYERGCHGTNTTYTDPATPATPAARLIQPEMSKTHRHPVNLATPTVPVTSGLHKNVSGGESVTQLDYVAGNRHAECMDCHNPHQARAAVDKLTRGAIGISAALKGVWGIDVILPWPTLPSPPTTNAITFPSISTSKYVRKPAADVTNEYQVCFKCHSNYVTLPAGIRNIAQEANPTNSSYHGIVPGGTTNTNVNTTTAYEPWGSSSSATYQRVWCSDCHGMETATYTPSRPYGPHGSTNDGAGPGTSNTDKMLVKTIASTSSGTPLCLVCHKTTSYQTGFTGSRSNRHGTASMTSEGCFACHMWNNSNAPFTGDGKIYPHGLNARWVTYPGGGAASGQMVDAFNGGWYTNMNYTSKQCWATDSKGNKISGSPCGTHANGGTY